MNPNTSPQSVVSSEDKLALVTDVVGGSFSAVFTLENDHILNLKSLGKKVQNLETQNKIKFGTGDLTIGEKFKTTKVTIKNVSGASIDGAKHGAIVDGTMSAIINTYKVLTGKEKGADAISSMVADTTIGAVSGASGAVSGGIAAIGLGASGITGTILVASAGVIGAVGFGFIAHKMGIYDSIKNTVKSIFTK